MFGLNKIPGVVKTYNLDPHNVKIENLAKGERKIYHAIRCYQKLIGLLWEVCDCLGPRYHCPITTESDVAFSWLVMLPGHRMARLFTTNEPSWSITPGFGGLTPDRRSSNDGFLWFSHLLGLATHINTPRMIKNNRF